MPSRRRHALVCELHAHTRPVRDGSLSLPELVDLYGDAGFDVLCVTDHVVSGDEHVHAGNHAAYLAAIDEQAVRARERHGLLLLPCEQHPDAVVEYLRSRRPAFLVPSPSEATLARAS